MLGVLKRPLKVEAADVRANKLAYIPILKLISTSHMLELVFATKILWKRRLSELDEGYKVHMYLAELWHDYARIVRNEAPAREVHPTETKLKPAVSGVHEQILGHVLQDNVGDDICILVIDPSLQSYGRVRQD